MNHPTQFPEVTPAPELKESAFSTPTRLEVDILPASSTVSHTTLLFEWDDLDTGTLDDFP